jgi:hypothetical protein
MNQITAWRRLTNDGHEYAFAVDAPEQRHYYEFVEFIRMFDQKDSEKMKEMLTISLAVSEIMEKARNQAGIVFDNDR